MIISICMCFHIICDYGILSVGDVLYKMCCVYAYGQYDVASRSRMHRLEAIICMLMWILTVCNSVLCVLILVSMFKSLDVMLY